MKRILLLFALLLVSLFAPLPVCAQTPPLTLVTGTITAQASTCQPQSGSAACVFLQLNPAVAQVSITIPSTTTFSATLQFEWSPDGGTTWVALSATPNGGSSTVTSTTSTGVWVANTGGASFVRVRCSSYSSGVATVTLNPSQAAAASSSSSSGGVTSVTGASPVTSSGGTTPAIGCATCAIGPGSSTASHLAEFAGTDGVTLKDGGAAPTGTVTSVGFAGDGTLLSSTPGTPVSSSGNVSDTLANAAADTVWGNATGSSAAPGYTGAPVVSSISAVGSSGVSAGAVGAAGKYSFVGSTSGTATCTAPAVAGTTSNPVTCTNALSLPAGAVGTPSLMGGGTNSGIYFLNGGAAGEIGIAAAGSAVAGFFSASPGPILELPRSVALGFGASLSSNGDTGISSLVAGVFQFGNGTVNDETALLRSGLPCRISTAVTLTTTTAICSWTLPASAKTWSYACRGMYQTSTSSITLLLGTQFSQAPTNSTHSAIIWSAASTQTFAQATNAGTTAVTTMTGVAPSSSTPTPWQATGTFTGSATSGTFTIYGTASTSSDAQINGGSSCELY